jgi:RNA polymerase sigma-70 factor (ECF subfamily)
MDEQGRYQWLATNLMPYEGEIRGWLRRHAYTLSAADVDDVIQEAYARLWSANFACIDNGRSYFYTVVRNLLLEQARRARIVPMERLGEIESLSIISSDSGPERRVSAREELAQLLTIVASLPTQCRRAFELQKLEGCSQREIAQQMGISEKTVEKHLARALARVIEAMSTQTTGTNSIGTALGAGKHDTDRKRD